MIELQGVLAAVLMIVVTYLAYRGLGAVIDDYLDWRHGWSDPEH